MQHFCQHRHQMEADLAIVDGISYCFKSQTAKEKASHSWFELKMALVINAAMLLITSGWRPCWQNHCILILALKILWLIYWMLFSELPELFPLIDVTKALLRVPNGSWFICRLLVNFPDFFEQGKYVCLFFSLVCMQILVNSGQVTSYLYHFFPVCLGKMVMLVE